MPSDITSVPLFTAPEPSALIMLSPLPGATRMPAGSFSLAAASGSSVPARDGEDRRCHGNVTGALLNAGAHAASVLPLLEIKFVKLRRGGATPACPCSPETRPTYNPLGARVALDLDTRQPHLDSQKTIPYQVQGPSAMTRRGEHNVVPISILRGISH